MRKAVLVELMQEIIRKIARRLVDLVDQHHSVAIGFVGFPQRPLVQKTMPYCLGLSRNGVR